MQRPRPVTVGRLLQHFGHHAPFSYFFLGLRNANILHDLLIRIKSGDESALEEIYRTHRKPFIAWMQSKFQCSEEVAIELIQASVVILYDNIYTGTLSELTGSLRTYLFGIGRNKWREYNRYRKRMNPHDAFDHFALIDPEDDHANEDRTSEVELLAKALRKLGDPCKSMLEAFYYQKLSMEEICLKLGYKNTDTAKNIKYKCLQRLRRIFRNTRLAVGQ